MKQDTIQDRIEYLLEIGSVIPTSEYYDDCLGKFIACNYVHLTKENPKTYLVTEWRPNHFSPDRFKPIKKQQKLMKKDYIVQQLTYLLEASDTGRVLIDGCTYCTEKEMIKRHKQKLH